MVKRNDQLVVAQKKLALLLGGLAIALPTILYLGNLWIYGVNEPLSSMSSYYYSNMRDVFVGILFSMAVFLITYEGYGTLDRLMSSFGGILSLIVALAPTAPLGQEPTLINQVHLLAAAVFYLILAIFCIFRFTKSGPHPMTGLKKVRNVIYYTAGFLILGSLLLLLLSGFDVLHLPIINPVFWLEYVANTAFGVAFLVKGEGVFVLNDDPIFVMNPWEVFGFSLLLLLVLGNFFMLSNVLIF